MRVPCTGWSPGSASATATCRKDRSGSTPTSRCDRSGRQAYGTRCEIKNLNSFRFLERAINFEVRRQIELIGDGGRVVQETRLYDPDADETRSMRSKEDAHDYRYFPDPDLPALVIEPERIEAVRAAMPELPAGEAPPLRGASSGSATTTPGADRHPRRPPTISRRRRCAVVAGQAVPMPARSKQAANWIMVELAAQLNRDGLDIAGSTVSAGAAGAAGARIADGTISGQDRARHLPGAMDASARRRSRTPAGARSPDAVDRIIDEKGLRQISDSSALEPLVERVLAENEKSVQEFRAGKEKAFNALVGQVMKASRGKANPQQVNELLRAEAGRRQAEAAGAAPGCRIGAATQPRSASGRAPGWRPGCRAVRAAAGRRRRSGC